MDHSLQRGVRGILRGRAVNSRALPHAIIQEERVRNLNEEGTLDGDYVLYWMQASQRAEHNHALEYAVQQANRLDQRLLVVFGLTDDYPEANLRHYAFMLEGLQAARETLKGRGIKLVVREGSPDEVALEAGKNASLIVTDRGYTRPQKRWRENLAEGAGCLVTQVESDVVVPVELASEKRETAARTLRPKLNRHLDKFLVELRPTKPEKQSLNMDQKCIDLSDVGKVLYGMRIDRSVGRLSHLYRGRYPRGEEDPRSFPQEQLRHLRREPKPAPDRRRLAHEQIPAFRTRYPRCISRFACGTRTRRKATWNPYLDELIVRRELSITSSNYTPDYHPYSCLPGWAKETLKEHKNDEREQPTPASSSRPPRRTTHTGMRRCGR